LDDVALSPANRLGPETGLDDYNPAFSRCIGSACMMWVWLDKERQEQWIDPDRVKTFTRNGWHQAPHSESDEYSVLMVREYEAGEVRRGTCGLIRSQP
jgi:hypothetical protein